MVETSLIFQTHAGGGTFFFRLLYRGSEEDAWHGRVAAIFFLGSYVQ